MTRDEHRSRIGASMAPAVLGVSPYKDQTPLGAYLFFTGQTDGPEETAEMSWGSMVEDAIEEAAEQHFGVPILYPVVPRIHRQFPFVGATPDGMLDDGRGLEIKNVTDPARAAEWGEPGTDQVPTYTMVQVQQQAAVFDFEVVEVAVSLFGRPPVFYSVPRNQDIIDRIIKVEAAFWLRVQERRPPDPDWTHPDTPRLVEMLRRPEPGRIATIHDRDMPKFLRAVAAYEQLGPEIGFLQRQRDEWRAHMVQLMADGEVAMLPDGRRVKRRLVPASEPKMSKGRKEYCRLDILKGERHGPGSDEDHGDGADGAA